MDGFYGSFYSTGDNQYHNYEDNKALLPSENLLTPSTVYHHDPQHHYNSYHFSITEHQGRADDVNISPVLGPSDQELRFQSSCSGVVVSGPPDSVDVSHNRREGVLHGHDHKQVSSLMKAKIASHPSYPKLLSAYIDCQKVGAPLEMVTLLDQIRREADHLYDQESVSTSSLGDDPELDEFMDTFCEVLFKCRSDLSRPFDEATAFLNTVESQLANLTCNDESALLSASDDEEDTTTNNSIRSEISIQDLQMKNEDHRKTKEMLLRRYGGSSHFGRLKMLFSNNKKKVKLPKEARQALLDWWNLHYKWPYPTEADKMSLAESTGLDQKQINNWFINQRKRHWKSSDGMHLTMMDNYPTHFFNED